MTAKTIRFNEKETKALREILNYYKMDFSSTIKRLVLEKIEDLRDIKEIKKISESKPDEYVTAKHIDSLFDKS